MQEPSGIERRDITNNTPGEALWIRGFFTEDHQIRSGDWTPNASVKVNEKKKIRKQKIVQCVNAGPR